MKRTVWLTGLLFAAVLAFCLMTGFSGPDMQAFAVPPLKLDGDLLNEKLPEPPAKKTKVKADNTACYVCHGNYNGEPFALIHAKADVACTKCHGKSFAHRNDEDNITPPEIMYAADQIDEACEKCHDTHDAPAKKVIARWQQCCLAKTNFNELVCTDCHGKHRLARRTVRWDKKTGKLIIRKTGQATKAQ